VQTAERDVHAPREVVTGDPGVVAEAKAPDPPGTPRAGSSGGPPGRIDETTVSGAVTAVESSQPTAVTPMRPAAPTGRPKPARQASSRRIVPGDLICGECGESNAPARNFCSRCGTSLRDAVVAGTPWWRRIVPTRKRKAMEAGNRPWKNKHGTEKSRTTIASATWRIKRRPLLALGVLAVAVVVVLLLTL
jgi:hypothetical protein